MNAKKHSLIPMIVLAVVCGSMAMGQTAQDLVRSGNTLYGQGQYDQATGQYDKALTENPRLDQARFNKADAFYRMDDLAKAIDLYNEVSSRTKDMDLVRKAKYNLGNAYFERGIKQKDSNLQKAVDDLKTSIGYWRAVLDLDPDNANAKRNKEVAGLIIKDILDQIKKQQEKKNSDPNQPKDPNQKSEDRSQKSEDKKNQQGQDPNQTQEDRSQKPEEGKQGQDPNQAKDPNQNQQPKENPQVMASDRTAQEILDKEQQKKKERQMQVRTGHIPVDKDW